jgi:carboxylesterase type B
MMSGTFVPILENTDTMRPVADRIVKMTKCAGNSTLDCLRKLSSAELLDVSTRTNNELNSPLTTVYGPIIDNYWVKVQHHESLRTGKFRKVPLLISTAKDEGEFLSI